jgi:tRNA A22 N-methylase
MIDKRLSALSLILILGTFCVSGCANKKKALRQIDDLVLQSRTVDCDTLRNYLEQVHAQIQRELN